MAMSNPQSPTANERINDLYWHSTRTIDEIIDENGIGRSTLYASIVPLSVDAACSTCGGAMVFTNRMNRASGTASCDDCGLTLEMGSGEGDEPFTTPFADHVRRTPRAPAPPSWDRVARIGGAAALGVMIGAAAVRAAR